MANNLRFAARQEQLGHHAWIPYLIIQIELELHFTLFGNKKFVTDNSPSGVPPTKIEMSVKNKVISSPPSGQSAGGGARTRTRNRRVRADLRADSLATVLPPPLLSR
ncbi:hypothetical protein PoB_002903200 [Plakobranchus ocellatus]|uniref:Uncharacterized protein n=1 Tax=Plakobranchus ocellatus TaxID=259542 RepID=A0AAV4A5J6_9GAST|nr:hypothetical protein PoB_002903200 [Plakobranchus ocellatus]